MATETRERHGFGLVRTGRVSIERLLDSAQQVCFRAAMLGTGHGGKDKRKADHQRDQFSKKRIF